MLKNTIFIAWCNKEKNEQEARVLSFITDGTEKEQKKKAQDKQQQVYVAATRKNGPLRKNKITARRPKTKTKKKTHTPRDIFILAKLHHTERNDTMTAIQTTFNVTRAIK